MGKIEREYRAVPVLRSTGEQIVEGYACTFNEPYELYECDGVTYREMIAPDAFEGADLSDVIMQYDHSGRVYARQSNGTLTLHTDEHGLYIRADLSKSDGARQLYEEIRSGLITKMSFSFTIGDMDYDRQTHLSTITKIKRVYDVSAVSIPANPYTEISARSYLSGVIDAERKEQKRKVIQILLEVM